MNPKGPTPRHIMIKMPNFNYKERILKAAMQKYTLTYKGALIRQSADFSTETVQARREWKEIFQVMRNKSLQPRLLYPERLSFKMEGKPRYCGTFSKTFYYFGILYSHFHFPISKMRTLY